MSKWTHVNMTLRVDNVPDLNQFYKRDLDRLVKKDLPEGSEGKLRWKTHTKGDGLPWGLVNVWGDLRDYDTEEGILNYATNLINNLQTPPGYKSIRSGILEIDIEYKYTAVYRVEDISGKDQWVLIYRTNLISNDEYTEKALEKLNQVGMKE